MNRVVWTHFHTLSAADTLSTVGGFIDLDPHFAFFMAETTFSTFATVDLVTV